MKALILISILTIYGCSKDSSGQTDNPTVTETTSKTITFEAKDGLTITADLYQIKNDKGFVVLCHQAGYSRGEYLEIAKQLNTLGFSCMAIDQRSGNAVKGVVNETAKLAKEKGLSTNYLDARQDIEAAVEYATALNNKNKIILVGSSYSASLVLLIATTNDNVKAVASFSPGEYLDGVDLATSISAINIPVFVTSSKSEIAQTSGVIKNVNPEIITHFKPEVKGIHGSSALWSSTSGNDTYWKAFTDFLNNQ